MNRAWTHTGLGVLAAVALLAGCERTRSAPLPPEPAPAPALPSGPIAVTNVTVIDVASGTAQTNVTVLTRGQDIVAVARDAAIPDDAVRVDGTGRFLIPGLWDMHAHHQGTGAESVDLFVANGVVGTRDMGADVDFILPLRDRINRGELLGPQIVATGPILDDRPAHWPFRRRVTNAADGRAAVRDLKARGVDFIKVHDGTPREAFFAMADEAKKAGLPLVGHVPFGIKVEEAVDAGIKSIEHLANYRVLNDCSVSPPHTQISCDELYGMLVSRGVWQTPTLTFFQLIPEMFTGQPLPHAEYASDVLLEMTRQNVKESNLDERALSFFRTNNTTSLEKIRALAARGVRFLAACDGLVPGFCLHDELEWMTKAGLSPLQALQTATSNPAAFLARESSQGTVAVGKRADLVLLDGDPSADIRNTRRIAAVIVRGRLLARPDLDRILASHRRADTPR
jgi:imidazolonepropionase-like amidohydrolase